MRFKPGNVIIVSTIPRPKKPDNLYLRPMVDDLLLLWKGVNFKMPHSMLSSKLIRAGISSDIPAVRKICGFHSCHAPLWLFQILATEPDYSGLIGPPGQQSQLIPIVP